MADEARSADRTDLVAGAEALQRAQEEVANLTVEENTDRRERLVSLLNTVGQKFADISDRADAEKRRDGDTDESGKVVVDDRSDADARKNRR